MEYNVKRKIAGSVIYIILALLIVAIMCIAVFTMANTGKKPSEDDKQQTEIETTAANVNETVKPAETSPEEETVTSGTTTTETNPVEETTAAMVIEENISDDKDTSAEKVSKDELPVVNEPSEPVNAPLNFTMPVRGYISKDYDSEMLVYSLTMNDYRVHSGIDIDSVVGAPVYACANGIIKNIYDDPFMGKCIVIDHGEGLKSYYMNLSSDIPQGIEENGIVESGQVIAGIGETSMLEVADNMHLHFEMTLNGETVNPLNYIPYDVSTGITYSDD